eukprot:NODE_28837_length_465_cov_0.727811.p3 GENE.NODE_28837_length_465_cov_0.727811~~NODE_28837_length_465_cov_0.727811.p3  ORF type:complete len:71 (+),score=3.92 NODE_28837_length_465_cov_0.727811:245-457(+)
MKRASPPPPYALQQRAQQLSQQCAAANAVRAAGIRAGGALSFDAPPPSAWCRLTNSMSWRVRHHDPQTRD